MTQGHERRTLSRLRVIGYSIGGVIALLAVGFLILSNTLFSPPVTPFSPGRTLPNTDVNPYGATFFLEREVEAWKRERTVQMAREAGLGWARQQFVWAQIEPEQGVYDWGKYDAIVDLLRRNNLQIIARLDSPPGWARRRASGTGSSGPPDDYRTYGAFVREFVKRYHGRVNYLQIWNEPNLAREWNDGPINPRDYTELLRIAYAEAKDVDPNVRILSAPLAITLGEPYAPGSSDFRNMNDLQFLEEMYAAGAKEYFDILSANAFGLGGPPDDPPNPGKLNFQRVLLEREIMERNGDSGKAVWILEYGWNAAPEWIPDSRLIWGRVTEEQQAAYTIQGIEKSRAMWDWVGVFSIWYFRQVGDIQPSNPEYYFRMVDVDFAPRPVYFGVSGAAKSHSIAPPGEYQETNPALELRGDWLTLFDDVASAGQYAESGTVFASGTLKFYGEGLDLVIRRFPGGGRLYVSLDGHALNGLAKDEAGKSYIDQSGEKDEWRIVMPVARGLPRGQHTLELEAEGRVTIDGFIVPALAQPEFPWVAVSACTAAAVILFVLAWRARAPSPHNSSVEAN